MGERLKKRTQQPLFAGGASLREQRLRMVGILDVLMAVVAARMAGDELILMVDADPLGVGLEGHARAGIFGGHRIAVGVQRHAELAGGAHRGDCCAVVGHGIERLEMGLLFGKQVQRAAMRLAVQAHIGDGVEPDSGGGVERAEVE